MCSTCLRRIPGVGRVSNIGSRYYAMQIWASAGQAGKLRFDGTGLAERIERPKSRIGSRRFRTAAGTGFGHNHSHYDARPS